MRTFHHTLLLAACLVSLLAACSTRLATDDPVWVARPAGTPPRAGPVRSVGQAPLGEHARLSYVIQLHPAMIDPDTGDRWRLLRIVAREGVGAIDVIQGLSDHALDPATRHPVTLDCGGFRTGQALDLAAASLGYVDGQGRPTLEPVHPSREVGCYELGIAPREELTWGDVASDADLRIELRSAD